MSLTRRKKMVKTKRKKKCHMIIKVRYNDWGGLIYGIKECFVKSISAKNDEDLKYDIQFLALSTDEFHPLNTEEELAYDLPADFFDSMAEARDVVNEYLKDMLKEMQDNAVAHYSNPMNLAPEQANVTKMKIIFKPVSLKHLQKFFTFTKKEFYK